MRKIKTKLIYPIFLKQIGCPNRCIYCNQFLSDTIYNEIGEWEKDGLVFDRDALINFINKNQNKDKEIAFYGGSFTCLPKAEILAIFNQFKPVVDIKTFFRLSTRPDAINPEILAILKENKVSTIELGIQSFSDKALFESKRGYDRITAIEACKSIVDYGFNLTIQFLIGLPGDDMNSHEENIKTFINLKPDYIRLYPLLVLKDTELEILYNHGDYVPLTVDEAVEICKKYYNASIENNIKVIKIGLHTDISDGYIIAGPYHKNIGELVRK